MGKVVGVLLFVTVATLLFAFPFMWMWNYAVVSALTVAKPISYWVAFCLMWFISIFIAANNNNSK
jgi:hypothetical protein